MDTTTCVITAHDFDASKAHQFYGKWTPGKLRHVAAALKDVPVVLTTDSRTGSALIGATLTGVRRNSRVAGNYALYYIDANGYDGCASWHSVGHTIVPLENLFFGRGKWEALQTYSAEQSAAVRHFRDQGVEGILKAEPGADWVDVTAVKNYSDHYGKMHRVKLADLNVPT
ncbi:hypothetical protein CH253_08005 [Rhodococcus sp. 06-156-3C]|uniref:hypothetical protein n=1 Tax=Rhodococcus sp. 06-156-3C TaxID=2022486 RepID=UPI000B9A464D|nr:hypothetical protein [Rhodococcus sp. 06-156-3C]OZD23796.1 hypothetical protein CH253_08005 [Rhodococcus sp. 06-156-3C]